MFRGLQIDIIDIGCNGIVRVFVGDDGGGGWGGLVCMRLRWCGLCNLLWPPFGVVVFVVFVSGSWTVLRLFIFVCVMGLHCCVR